MARLIPTRTLTRADTGGPERHGLRLRVLSVPAARAALFYHAVHYVRFDFLCLRFSLIRSVIPWAAYSTNYQFSTTISFASSEPGYEMENLVLLGAYGKQIKKIFLLPTVLGFGGGQEAGWLSPHSRCLDARHNNLNRRYRPPLARHRPRPPSLGLPPASSGARAWTRTGSSDAGARIARPSSSPRCPQ